MSLRQSILKTGHGLVFVMLSPIMIGHGNNVIVDIAEGLNPSCEVRASSLNDSTHLRMWTDILSDADYEVLDSNCDGRIDAMERYMDGIDRIIPDRNLDVDLPAMPFGGPWPFTVA